MNYRPKEFIEIEIDARWLDLNHACHAYDYACKYIAKDRYGLNTTTVSQISIHKITSDSIAGEWLSANFPKDGTVQIVFGRKEVCVIDTNCLISQWFDIFTPGRDDAVILHNTSKKIMFYCHEQEFEIGIRKNV